MREEFKETASPSLRGAEGGDARQDRRAGAEPVRAARHGDRKRVLLLAGTSEARALAARLAADPRYDAIASLAGRTSAPAALAAPTRVGGFGGVEGLKRYLIEAGVECVVDATHPFAARMSANAQAACAALGLPLIAYARAPWRAAAGDNWIEAADNAAAVRALGETPRRVFLTIGRQGVADFRAAPWHDYLLRVIEPPDARDLPPNCETICARGPFAREDEIALLREKRIELVVSKNSGGALTYAKIEAARELGLPVVMIAPPARDGARVVHDLDAVMALLAS